MATVIRYINTASTSGGDGTTNNTTGATRAYASASEWEAAEETDLVADGDNHHVYTDGSGGVDTALLDIFGWITDATHGITVEALGSQRNDGVSRDKSGTGYKLGGAGNEAIRFRTKNITVIGIEATAINATLKFYADGGGEDYTVEDCLIYSSSTGTYPVEANSTVAKATIKNSLVITPSYRSIDFRNVTVGVIDHVGMYGGGNFGLVVDSKATVTNSWAVGFTSECFWTGGSTPSGSNNSSSDGSASTDYANSVVNIVEADEFTDPTTNLTLMDFTLKSGSNLIDAGTGSLATDISDASRSGTVDIGPWEFVSSIDTYFIPLLAARETVEREYQ